MLSNCLLIVAALPLTVFSCVPVDITAGNPPVPESAYERCREDIEGQNDRSLVRKNYQEILKDIEKNCEPKAGRSKAGTPSQPSQNAQ